MDWLRWDVVSWGALALLLMAAETLVPGAFMLRRAAPLMPGPRMPRPTSQSAW